MTNNRSIRVFMAMLIALILSIPFQMSARRAGSGWTSEVNERNADMTVSGRTHYWAGGQNVSMTNPTRTEYFRWYQLGNDAEMYKDYYYDFSPSNASLMSQSLINRFFQRGGAGMGFAVSHSDSENKDYIYVIGAGGNGDASTPASGNNTIYYYDVATGAESSFTIPRNTGTFNDPYGTVNGAQLTRQYNNAGYVNYCIFNDEHGNIMVAQCDNSYNLKAFLVLPRGFTRTRDCDSSGAAQHFIRFTIEPDDINYSTASAKTTWANKNPRLNILSKLDVRHLALRAYHDCWDQIGYIYITIPGQPWFYRLRLNGQDSDKTTPASTTPKWYSPGAEWNNKKWYVQLSDIEEHHTESTPADDVENVSFYYYNSYYTPSAMRPGNEGLFTNACTITPYASNRLFVQLSNDGCYWVESIFKGSTVGQTANSKNYNPNGNDNSPALKADGSKVAENTYTFTFKNKVTNSNLRYTTPGATAFLLQGGAFAVYPVTGGNHERGIRIEPKTDNEMLSSSGDIAFYQAELLPNSTRKQNFAGAGQTTFNGTTYTDAMAANLSANSNANYNSFTIAKPASSTAYQGMAWWATTTQAESVNGTWTGNVGNNVMADNLVPGVYSQVLRVDYKTVDIYFFSRNVGIGKVRVVSSPKPLTNGRGYGHFRNRHRIQWDCPGTRGCYGYRVEVKIGTGAYTTLYGSTDANLWTPVAHNSVNAAGADTYKDVTFDDSNSSRLGKSCTYRITPVYKTMGWNGESVDWSDFILEDGPSLEIPVTVPSVPTPSQSFEIVGYYRSVASNDNPTKELLYLKANWTVTQPNLSGIDSRLTYSGYCTGQAVEANASTAPSFTAGPADYDSSYNNKNSLPYFDQDISVASNSSATVSVSAGSGLWDLYPYSKYGSTTGGNKTYYARVRSEYNYTPGDTTKTETVYSSWSSNAGSRVNLAKYTPSVTVYSSVIPMRQMSQWWGDASTGSRHDFYYDVYLIGLQLGNGSSYDAAGRETTSSTTVSGNPVSVRTIYPPVSYFNLTRNDHTGNKRPVTDCTYGHISNGYNGDPTTVTTYGAKYPGNTSFSTSRHACFGNSSYMVNEDYQYWIDVTKAAKPNSVTDPTNGIDPDKWDYQLTANYAQRNTKLSGTSVNSVTTKVAVDVITGIDGTTSVKKIRQTLYYNLQGVIINEAPTSGTYIEVRLYDDGSVETKKVAVRR